MPIELSELMDLAMGRRPHLYVGELPRAVAEHLCANPGLVYLGSSELFHIIKKHREVSHEEVQFLHMAIKNGKYFQDKNRKKCVTIIWKKIEPSDFYIIGLKAANSGEVWVQTMHRITKKKAGKRKKKYFLLHG